MPAYQLQKLQQNTEELLAGLEAEIRECSEVRKTCANKVKKFMTVNEIWHLVELDYSWREAFEEFLKTEVKPASYRSYLEAFDRLKQHTLYEGVRLIGQRKYKRPAFENQILFLLYHPDPKIARKFELATKKKDLVWDFSISAPERMKRQIFQILHRVIEEEQDQKQCRAKLVYLRIFYNYCVEAGIQDIEQMETEQIETFKKILQKENAYRKASSIVDYARECLFMETDRIHWEANVWYMGRFHLEAERLNPAKPVRSISFLEITNLGNRNMLKKYMRYTIGLTTLALSDICQEFYLVRKFLVRLPPDLDICWINRQQMEQSLWLLEKELQTHTAAYYNDIVMALVHFFQFLKVQSYIQEIPFQPGYFLKKEIFRHNDRSVPKDAEFLLLRNLYRFPEEIRLMYLHLWALGLRISEVCTLKGNAYYIRGKDAWIQIYQIKMKTWKKIPIPEALYQLMQIYMKRHGIGPDSYVFSNRKGEAYKTGTFRKKMLECCEKCGIQECGYLFRSHDFRHGVATRFYDSKVSLQSVREYLGHEYEEMTLQYVDYMPKKIDQANEEFFSRLGRSLAACLGKEVKQ